MKVGDTVTLWWSEWRYGDSPEIDSTEFVRKPKSLRVVKGRAYEYKTVYPLDALGKGLHESREEALEALRARLEREVKFKEERLEEVRARFRSVTDMIAREGGAS